MKLTDQAKKLIDGKNFASVATLMPDGSLQVTPVWVDREGDVVILNAAKSRQKTRNLKRDPRIAITIFDQNNPYSNVSLRGKAIEITEEGGEAHIDKLNMKYHGSPNYPRHNPQDPRTLIKVRVDRLANW
ncbi:MAG: PPOX class F420-dependent oxidoreductase [Thaumarchaeota archaeon]|nr:PPOX class F420-dependent oxidoreductase [Nitrososphaerota archaeon]